MKIFFFSLETSSGNSLPFCSSWIGTPCHFFAVLCFIFALASLEMMVSHLVMCAMKISQAALSFSWPRTEETQIPLTLLHWGWSLPQSRLLTRFQQWSLSMLFPTKLCLQFTPPGEGSCGSLYCGLTFFSNYSIAFKYLEPAQSFLGDPCGSIILTHRSPATPTPAQPPHHALLPPHELVARNHGAVKGTLAGLEGRELSKLCHVCVTLGKL